MADVDDRKIVNKTTVIEELEYWNALYVFRRIKLYFRNKLRWSAPKNMQGLQADDFAMTVMLKIITEDVSWQRSSKISFMDFVYDTTRGEWSHFLRDNKNKIFISFDDDVSYAAVQNQQLMDKFNGF